MEVREIIESIPEIDYSQDITVELNEEQAREIFPPIPELPDPPDPHLDFEDVSKYEDREFSGEVWDLTAQYNAYVEMLRDGQWHSQELIADWQLPGMGTSRQSCQVGIYFRGCKGPEMPLNDIQQTNSDMHTVTGLTSVKPTVMSCHQLQCLKCIERTIGTIATRAKDRLLGFNLFLSSNLYERYKKTLFAHHVVSVPKEDYDNFKDDGYRKKKENQIRKNLKKIGFIGGCLVFHPYRFSKKLQSFYWSPHYHLISCGWSESTKIKEVYEKTGYVYRTLRVMRSDKELTTLLMYLLSHSGLKKIRTRNIDSVRYYGLCQNRYFKTSIIFSNDSNIHSSVSDITHHIIFPKGNQTDNSIEQQPQGLDEHVERKEKPKQKELRFQECKIQAVNLNDQGVDVSNLEWSGVITTKDESKISESIRELLPDPRTEPEWLERAREYRRDHPLQKANAPIAEKCPHDHHQPNNPDQLSEEELDSILDEEPEYDDCLSCPVEHVTEDSQTRAVIIIQARYAVYSEKCQLGEKMKRYLYFIDPGTKSLCNLCRSRLRRIIPQNLKDDLTYLLKLTTDTQVSVITDWRYYDYNYDGLKGIPYWVLEEPDTPRYETGELIENEHNSIQPQDMQVLQDMEIYDSRVSAKEKEVKARWESGQRPSKEEIHEIAMNELKIELQKQQQKIA